MARQVFVSWDGTEHPSKKAADQHDKLMLTTEEFAAVAKKLRRTMAAQLKTGDGEFFDLDESRDYWFVRLMFGHLPQLEKVWMYPHSLEFDFDRKGVCVARIWNAKQDKYEQYAINELYSTEEAGREALVKKCDEVYAEICTDLKAIKDAYIPKIAGG